MQAIDGSLTRFRFDYVDLVFCHRPDPDTPLEETLEAYGELLRSGKVRAIGASNHSAESLQRAAGISAERGLPRYESIQPLYNLFSREDFESKLVPVVMEQEIGVINYFPLAAGFLTGKYRGEADMGKSPRGASMKKYFNERGFRILEALDRVAERLDAKPAQVAIAWVLSNPRVTAPIASATTLAQLRELIAATRIPLDPESRAELDAASN